MPAGRVTHSFWRNPECICASHIDDATVAPVAAPKRCPKPQQMGFRCTSSVSNTYLFWCHPDIWTGRLVCALDAYRVAVLWAEATCGYITAGRFDTAAEPGEVPAPKTGTVLDRLRAQ